MSADSTTNNPLLRVFLSAFVLLSLDPFVRFLSYCNTIAVNLGCCEMFIYVPMISLKVLAAHVDLTLTTADVLTTMDNEKTKVAILGPLGTYTHEASDRFLR